jgi:hypothetical protein
MTPFLSYAQVFHQKPGLLVNTLGTLYSCLSSSDISFSPQKKVVVSQNVMGSVPVVSINTFFEEDQNYAWWIKITTLGLV